MYSLVIFNAKPLQGGLSSRKKLPVNPALGYFVILPEQLVVTVTAH